MAETPSEPNRQSSEPTSEAPPTTNQAEATESSSAPSAAVEAKKNTILDKYDESKPSTEPQAKRTKKEWLAFKGAKHTRVGEEFQVSALPQPTGVAASPRQQQPATTSNGGSNQTETQQDSKEEKTEQ